jgi:hypothetical protein
MLSKDSLLISEAYLSALQNQKTATSEPAMEDIAEVNPEVTDRENVENPVTITMAAPVGPEAMPQGPSIEPNVEDENEELWMARSNLFSLYSNAKKIHNAVQTGIDPEPWAQQKLAVAADQVESVMKYIAYEAAEKGITL